LELMLRATFARKVDRAVNFRATVSSLGLLLAARAVYTKLTEEMLGERRPALGPNWSIL
jgi:hypothetical protein